MADKPLLAQHPARGCGRDMKLLNWPRDPSWLMGVRLQQAHLIAVMVMEAQVKARLRSVAVR